MIVKLPDGNNLEARDGATAADIAGMIGPGLARKAIGCRVTQNGHSSVLDLMQSLPGDCEVSIITASDEDADALYLLRHSTAHIMAEAICTLFPETKLVYGPPLEDGFYYDIDVPQALTPEHFPQIESEMARIIKEDRPFCRYEMPREGGMAKLRDEGSRYKIDNAERAEGDTLSFYVTGEHRGEDFEDLCRGPHIPRTGLVKAFKIRQVSRSHYRGDVNDQPLQRVYGTAFFTKSSLTAYLEQLEEAKKRDHRVIGKELELFSISDRVGSGLILWQPKGTTIRMELQNFLTEEMMKLGYDLVMSPHIGHLDLYRTSGHFPYYEDSQYPAMFESERGKAIQAVLQFAQGLKSSASHTSHGNVEGLGRMVDALQSTWGDIEGLKPDSPIESIIEKLYAAMASEPGYLLRPMNCPHHIQIYASRPRSYRDLPVRLAEYGTVYRYEQSGEIGGLTRVRGFTVDDAHLFCTSEQVQDELAKTVDLTRRTLAALGLTDYHVRVGLRDDTSSKWVGSMENWEKSQAAVLATAEGSGIDFTVEQGEAAFYGPKIDFVVRDCIGRKWQLGTVQCDYNLPERFDLTYVGSDNAPHRPVMIHRAPFGSMERFVGILIEHFAGAFPLWLSPVQVAVVTVSDKSVDYGRSVFEQLKAAGLRAVFDAGDEKVGPKKHRYRSAKVNYILVVGENEAREQTVNVNDRDGKSIGNQTLERFIGSCRAEIANKCGTEER